MLDPLASDTVQEVKNVTQGQGVDVGFDAAGVQVAVNTALKCLKARGTLVNIALWEDNKVTLDMSDMLWAERKYMAGQHIMGHKQDKRRTKRAQWQLTLMKISRRSLKPLLRTE